MSHFTVLVVANDEADLEAKLQPFHEYECTGMKDQYVRWVDEHDDHFNEYSNDTVSVLFRPDGSTVGTKYDRTDEVQRFWHRGGIGFSSKDEFIPADGYYLKDIPHSQYRSFDKYMTDWCGYQAEDKINGRWGRWTNPDSQWDWWVIGGRWTGLLKLKEDNLSTAREFVGNGEPGLMTAPNTDKTRCDFGRVGDIDFHAIRSQNAEDEMKSWQGWRSVVERFNLDESNDPVDEAETSQPTKETKSRVFEWARGRLQGDDFWRLLDFDNGGLHEGQAIEAAYSKAITFAYIGPDGQWVERGNMGWFAIVTDPNASYDRQFWTMIGELPEDQMIYVVDCHI